MRALLALALLPVLPACSDGPPVTVEITMHHSRFAPSTVTVPAGRAVRILLRNTDPIDHEWIVGDADVHARHETGSEPAHDTVPTEVSVEALDERLTTVVFDRPGTLAYVCHLPGHRDYGMSGTLVVR